MTLLKQIKNKDFSSKYNSNIKSLRLFSVKWDLNKDVTFNLIHLIWSALKFSIFFEIFLLFNLSCFNIERKSIKVFLNAIICAYRLSDGSFKFSHHRLYSFSTTTLQFFYLYGLWNLFVVWNYRNYFEEFWWKSLRWSFSICHQDILLSEVCSHSYLN